LPPGDAACRTARRASTIRPVRNFARACGAARRLCLLPRKKPRHRRHAFAHKEARCGNTVGGRARPDVEVIIYRYIFAECYQFFGKICHVLAGDDLSPDGPFQLVSVIIDSVERAVFGQQFQRGLVAHALDAGHVVGRIPGQRQEVEHQFRPDAPFRAHAFPVDRIPAACLARFQDGHGSADKLHQVLVARDDHALSAFGFAAHRDRRDDVVRLEPVLPQKRDTKRKEYFFYNRYLCMEIFGRFQPVRLVFVVQFVPERGRA